MAESVPRAADSDVARDCLVVAADLPRWRASSDLVIADTRGADEFRHARIPGSINIPSYALKTKRYLKPKHLLLVGSGVGGTELQPTCRALRAADFAAVGILEGGVSAWARAGGTVEGDRASPRFFNRLTAADFTRARAGRHWVLVDVSRRGVGASEQVVGRAARVPFDDPVRFRKELGDLLAQEKHDPSPFVLLIDERGELKEQLAMEAERLQARGVYVLEGGQEGYRRHRMQQEALIRSAADVKPCGVNECARDE